MSNLNKDYLLKESKTFCMFPWVHLYTSPRGKVYPCCTTDTSTTLGDTHNQSLEQIWNSDHMKQIRLDMLNDKPVNLCRLCYKMEESTAHTWRRFSNEKFEKYFDETVPQTQDDGTLKNFKLRFIDVRFSNICNFACRTCGGDCSSMWAAENKQRGLSNYIVLHADDHKGNLLQEVLSQVPNADMIYFAGGEPLITEEHYTILEALLKQNLTHIKLRYNTNTSTIKFKSFDLLDLWSRFDQIEIQASIDHYGERAEFIRHGTDWADVENNLILFRQQPNITVGISTVLSVFNYHTITDFYRYMLEKNLLGYGDKNLYLTLTNDPKHFCSKNLPGYIKHSGTDNIERFIDKLDYIQLKDFLIEAKEFTNNEDYWPIYKDKLKIDIYKIDKIRGQDFEKTFPEIASLLDA